MSRVWCSTSPLYQVHYLGPPAPPCEDARLATIRALNKMEAEKPEVSLPSVLWRTDLLARLLVWKASCKVLFSTYDMFDVSEVGVSISSF